MGSWPLLLKQSGVAKMCPSQLCPANTSPIPPRCPTGSTRLRDDILADASLDAHDEKKLQKRVFVSVVS